MDLLYLIVLIIVVLAILGIFFAGFVSASPGEIKVISDPRGNVFSMVKLVGKFQF